jgi:hypothetical protein
MVEGSRIERYAERKFLSGTWSGGMLIKRPTGRLAVSFRRTGVQPASGCLLFVPFWLFTRLRWSRGERTWSIVVRTTGPTRWQVNKPVIEEVVNSREAGRRVAADVLERVRRGDFDEFVQA